MRALLLLLALGRAAAPEPRTQPAASPLLQPPAPSLSGEVLGLNVSCAAPGDPLRVVFLPSSAPPFDAAWSCRFVAASLLAAVTGANASAAAAAAAVGAANASTLASALAVRLWDAAARVCGEGGEQRQLG